MKQKFVNTKTKVAAYILSACVVFGCSELSSDEFTPSAEPETDHDLNITETEPEKRDYSDIKESGTLRMITRYSSNSYFLHQGIEWGFEYELINEFADEHDLALEVIIVDEGESPYDMLNRGEGDIIANNYTVTPERSQYVRFTRPYNLVNQMVVYSSEVENPPSTLEELEDSDITLTVRRNSSYYNRLKTLQDEEGYDFNVDVVPGEKDTEALLADISEGKYKATVADDNIFQVSNSYMSGLQQGPMLSENDRIAWAIRQNAPDLESKLNQFLYKHFRFSQGDEAPKRSTLLNILRKRYFEKGSQLAGFHRVDQDNIGSGLISPYDDLIKTVADSAGIDWLIVASIAAQETKFNPQSQSWAGAIGLMQVMPRFSEVSDQEQLYNEAVNVKEGVRILSEHLRHYSYMDSTNQWAMALATYNAGPGHVADARRLVIDQNKDPNEWENVSDALLKLMQRKYYKDARYGFTRGIETVRYVKEINNRYETYKTILALYDEREQENPAQGVGVLGLFN